MKKPSEAPAATLGVLGRMRIFTPSATGPNGVAGAMSAVTVPVGQRHSLHILLGDETHDRVNAGCEPACLLESSIDNDSVGGQFHHSCTHGLVVVRRGLSFHIKRNS